MVLTCRCMLHDAPNQRYAADVTNTSDLIAFSVSSHIIRVEFRLTGTLVPTFMVIASCEGQLKSK